MLIYSMTKTKHKVYKLKKKHIYDSNTFAQMYKQYTFTKYIHPDKINCILNHSRKICPHHIPSLKRNLVFKKEEHGKARLNYCRTAEMNTSYLNNISKCHFLSFFQLPFTSWFYSILRFH